MQRFFLSIFTRWIFLFFYFAGLTFLIPSIISTSIPQSIFIFSGSPLFLILISILLILIGIIGMYFLKGDMKYAMRVLGWATIIPVLIAIFIFIFGSQFVLTLAERFEAIEPIVDHLLAGVPRAGYLIASYAVIAIGWFLVSRRMS